MTVQTTTRNATLSDLAALLQAQQGAKHDVVVSTSALHSLDANLWFESEPGNTYRPTAVADEGIASKFNIPVGYLKRLRSEFPGLYDENVNGWLNRDERSLLVRTFKGTDGGEGVARAVLSSNYRMIDNLDVLTAALDGVRAAGVPIEIQGADLTERRMYVRVVAPEVSALAPKLLERYRSPFSGQSGADLPVVFAGFVISNSETGGGAFTIVPRLVVQVCSNGMTITKDALRSVHIGGRLDEGVVRWSTETDQRSLALVTSQTKDAVSTFLDTDYVARTIASLETDAAKPVDKPLEAIQVVGAKLSYPQERIEAVLDHFIKGGDATAGGIFQAVTSVAQTLEDADQAFEMEGTAIRALELAAAL